MAKIISSLPNKDQLQDIRLGMRDAYLTDEHLCICLLYTSPSPRD